jgi:cysteinyl-tRNA synthetase
VVRFFILQSHYRSTLDFSADAVGGAGKGLEKLHNALRAVRERMTSAPDSGDPSGIDLVRYEAAFRAAMDEDFNAPQAIAVLFDLSRDVNTVLAKGTTIGLPALQQVETFFATYAGTALGIMPDDTSARSQGDSLEPGLMELMIALRADLRKEKLWSLSDRIRDGLIQLGVVLEDKKEGTTWKRTPKA